MRLQRLGFFASLIALMTLSLAAAVPAHADVVKTRTSNSPLAILPLGEANPYPSTLNVTDVHGVITDLNVTLNELSHSWPDDLDILLVGPGGASTILMSDACGDDTKAFVQRYMTFDDEDDTFLPDDGVCGESTNRPTDISNGSDIWPASIPTPQTTLSTFDGGPANGAWRLYVYDDSAGDFGQIARGFTLDFTMDPPPNTIVTKKPKKTTTSKSATIKFSSSESNSTFKCKVGTKKYKNCTSPLRLTKLTPGKKTVLIKAIDNMGSADPTPAKVKWTVKN